MAEEPTQNSSDEKAPHEEVVTLDPEEARLAKEDVYWSEVATHNTRDSGRD